MSRGLGHLQRLVLEALQQHTASVDLETLAYLAAGLIDDLRQPCPTEPPPPATYKAVARAVTGLERRGLVIAEMRGFYGTHPNGDRGHPGRLKKVRFAGDPD
jgi:hypothetical protein